MCAGLPAIQYSFQQIAFNIVLEIRDFLLDFETKLKRAPAATMTTRLYFSICQSVFSALYLTLFLLKAYFLFTPY